jgi:hypothetical protein
MGRGSNVSSTTRVALITGANEGIGDEVARQPGQRDITVLIGSRDAERGEEAVARLRAQQLDAHTMLIDVTDPSSVQVVGATQLADIADPGPHLPERAVANAPADIADFERRKARGELAEGPLQLAMKMTLTRMFELAMMGAVLAPVAMPQVFRRLTGLDPADPSFKKADAQQLNSPGDMSAPEKLLGVAVLLPTARKREGMNQTEAQTLHEGRWLCAAPSGARR